MLNKLNKFQQTSRNLFVFFGKKIDLCFLDMKKKIISIQSKKQFSIFFNTQQINKQTNIQSNRYLQEILLASIIEFFSLIFYSSSSVFIYS